MIKSKAELSREIEKRASTYTDEELFSSPYFYDYLQQTISAVCAKLHRTPVISAFCDQDDDTTAATNGNEIIINTLSPLVRELDTTWKKYLSIVGHITHECGHCLFTDFTTLNPLRKSWSEGEFKFYPKTPDIEGAKEFSDYLNTHKLYRQIYAKEMSDITNIIEDIYIENRLYEYFGGICTAGLKLSNNEKYRLSSSIEDLCTLIIAGKIVPLSAFKILIQIKKLGFEPKTDYSFYDDESVDDKTKDFVLKIKETFNYFLDLIDEELDELAWESDGLKRCDLLNRLFVKLRPLVYDIEDNLNENEPSEEGVNELANNSDDLAKGNGVSQEAKGYDSPIDKTQINKDKSLTNKDRASKIAMSKEIEESELLKTTKTVAKDECEAIDEKNHLNDLAKEANDIKNTNKKARGSSYFNKYEVARKEKKSLFINKHDYDVIYRKVAKTSQSLVRKINSILKERETESYETGMLMGQRFNSKDVYHNDGRYFSKINEPDGQIKVVFGVLVDESGSMYGDKCVIARQAAILLEDVLRNLNIPLLLCGHTENRNNCVIHPYVDFATNDGLDKYRLTDITAISGNNDGAAITYMGDRLLKRDEQIKVLIVISDGLPAGRSFYDEFSEDTDTKLAIEYYRKKGIKVFGAMVDEYDEVSKLYGEQFSFNCSHNLELEKQLVRLIKRYCLIK